ncbi:uncharacterized protein LOC133817767 isoform X2 [Humulus lupulus]|uniref:uncharacterized protein LOC133817767 isoform X2 n=1 Tax=Humulus lupulus TaxID=3486 RepID=UPI002B405DFE|nr:uncharacterized protein LOC133817767 isoform X2 [Humulus lupulus]
MIRPSWVDFLELQGLFEVLGSLGTNSNRFGVSKTSRKRSSNLAGDGEEEDSGEAPANPIWVFMEELAVIEVTQRVVRDTSAENALFKDNRMPPRNCRV